MGGFTEKTKTLFPGLRFLKIFKASPIDAAESHINEGPGKFSVKNTGDIIPGNSVTLCSSLVFDFLVGRHAVNFFIRAAGRAKLFFEFYKLVKKSLAFFPGSCANRT